MDVSSAEGGRTSAWGRVLPIDDRQSPADFGQSTLPRELLTIVPCGVTDHETIASFRRSALADMSRLVLTSTLSKNDYMKTTHLIRAATLVDAPRIAVLGAHVWVQTYAAAGVSDVIAQYVLASFTPSKFRALVEDSSIVLLVAEAGTSLAGYIVMRLGSSHADVPNEIETLYVQDSFAGRGIGSALLSDVRDIAMARTGNRSIWLAVNSQNDKAISFYRSRGMTQHGIVHFELGGTKHENMVMVSRD
jgi:ribosomal protein S18 acetylase RimI-like enzyme